MNTSLHLLCAGAAQGLVKTLQPRFEAENGAALQVRFGAAGAMKEALLAGEPCDVMIATAAMVDGLCAEGRLRADSRAALGRVATGVAVQSGKPHPPVGTPQALKAALLASREIYFADAERATAGIHFVKVMAELGVADLLAARLRTCPTGTMAMRELALARGHDLMGCAQLTEIKDTPGVELVGALPPQFALATTYTAAAAARSASPALALAFIALLAATDTRALRAGGGFEF